jgi:hypothetical protein
MRGLASLIGLIVVAAIGLFVYRSYFSAEGGAMTMGTNNPRAVVEVTGVKNDLIAMAQAERTYITLNGKYASPEDLHASGDLLVDPGRVRDGYTYSATVDDRHFTITATYSGPATGMPTLAIDETMQVSSR